LRNNLCVENTEFLNASTLSSQLATGATVALGGVPATAIKSAMSLVAEAMKK